MRVAEIDVAPGVDNAYHGLVAKIGGIEAALAQARAMPEGAQIVDAEPAMAAQIFGTFT
jgi:F0F1-type ATP synthase membrane subunit c/vacuolar-type H+-ATPase subunit K